jgi:hypothetical protein
MKEDNDFAEIGAAASRLLAKHFAGPYGMSFEVEPQGHATLGRVVASALTEAGWTISKDGVFIVRTPEAPKRAAKRPKKAKR